MRLAAEFAALAPSVHNTQPWRFVAGPHTLEVHTDPQRNLGYLDPDGRQMHISCGLAAEFARLPRMPLTFPSLVVCSSDDPYCSVERSRALAGIWRSEMVEIGAAGHINSASGLGDWDAGYALLQQLSG